MKWGSVKPYGSVKDKREKLDKLDGSTIIWTPYDDHRDVQPFDDIALFRGWLRCSQILCAYLPDRVFRQFGALQTVPDAPLYIPPLPAEIDRMWLHYHQYVVQPPRMVTFPFETVEEYRSWYKDHSHPLMRPPTPLLGVVSIVHNIFLML